MLHNIALRLVDASVSIIRSIWYAPLPINGNATPPSSQSNSPSCSSCHQHLSSQSSSSSSRYSHGGSSSSAIDTADEDTITDLEKNCTSCPQLPLDIFVRECLRRTLTSCTTLRVALLYCFRARKAVTKARLEFEEGRYGDAAELSAGLTTRFDLPELQPYLSVADDIPDGSDFDAQKGYFLAGHDTATALNPSLASSSSVSGPSVSSTPTGSPRHEMDLLSPPLSQGSPHYYESKKCDPIGENNSNAAEAADEVAEARHPNSPVRFCLDNFDAAFPRFNFPIILCGRRMFMIAILIATKFTHDRTTSNRAWSGMSGLGDAELSAMERRFLAAIDYNLYVGDEAWWQDWVAELDVRTAPDRARWEAQRAAKAARRVAEAASAVVQRAKEVLDIEMDEEVERNAFLAQEQERKRQRRNAGRTAAEQQIVASGGVLATAQALANALAPSSTPHVLTSALSASGSEALKRNDLHLLGSKRAELNRARKLQKYASTFSSSAVRITLAPTAPVPAFHTTPPSNPASSLDVAPSSSMSSYGYGYGLDALDGMVASAGPSLNLPVSASSF
ncbi:PHO85 cyclin-5 [Tilletia horrida]|nr:PHO85 cyclin-5 [Tilletia horrida]